MSSSSSKTSATASGACRTRSENISGSVADGTEASFSRFTSTPPTRPSPLLTAATGPAPRTDPVDPCFACQRVSFSNGTIWSIAYGMLSTVLKETAAPVGL
ncbi:hypothetical protein GCM10022416_31870 [Actinomadura keratinilytica]|uniref:MFS transporter n=1 Tax=Actinomadura keratinilytica TaxID=547461 RepID=A0ABP7YWV0_9ACTN